MGNAVLCKDRDTVGIYKFGDTVIDLGIDMIRTSRKHNALFARCVKLTQNFFTLCFDVVTCFVKLSKSQVNGALYFFFVYFGKFLNKGGADSLFAFKGKERIAKLNFASAYLIHVIFDIFGV